MKKLLTILIALMLLLSSCSTIDSIDVQGDKDKQELICQSGDITYVANISSKTYHLPSCHIAKRISKKNKWETRDMNFLVKRDFIPCKTCIK